MINFEITKNDLECEKQQCIDEGKDISELGSELELISKLDLSEKKNQLLAQSIFDKIQKLPIRPGYKYYEPSELEDILKHREKSLTGNIKFHISKNKLYDKIYGAWLGRCAGCLLGKPVEGWRRKKIIGYLKETGQFPLKDYIKLSKKQEIQKKYNIDKQNSFIDNIDNMPEDDDINYTVSGLGIIKEYGLKFTSENVAEYWLNNIPVLHTFTAERVAYRNFINSIKPPLSAVFCNPYREFIGAQIRADFWGYIMPGKPEKAAQLAYRDACISHIKNGIYGEMWVSAMLSSAYYLSDIEDIIQCGLSQIPNTSRLYENIKKVISWRNAGLTVDETINMIHQEYNEQNFYHWCHTISNAMIVATGLLYGEYDFEKSITTAVISGFDTDCNGATVGSILGILLGAKNLPEKWIKPLNNIVSTCIKEYNKIKISELATQTVDLIK